MLYSLVFLLQLLALAFYMAVITHVAPMAFFLYGTGVYLFSIILFFIGIARSKDATPLNCFTILLLLVNMIMIVLFVFTGYLGAFLNAHKDMN
jgi:hypothetical protein